MTETKSDIDEERRRSIASRPDTRPEFLAHLAKDKSQAVRRALAGNVNSGPSIDALLATDADDAVRADLAAKLTRLMPGLSPSERESVKHATLAIVELLAKDSLAVVRRIISEALQDLPNAPPNLVSLLARDSDLSVSEPILRYSPVLTDSDLLSIIASPPVQGALSAIAKRTGLTETISDAIIGTDDIAAIAELLSNESAQIREETLDLVIKRAADRQSWHGPLVRRPRLPFAAALKIARFVANDLLDELAARTDMDNSTRNQLFKLVEHRLNSGATRAKLTQSTANLPPMPADTLRNAGAMSDTLLLEAVRYGDLAFLLSAMATRTGLQQVHIQRAIDRRSARAIVALAIRGNLPAQLAVDIQMKFAKVPPGGVIGPIRDASGRTWRMTPEEADLEIELLQR
jgi:uncharacterized protein (DUF2336 family)